MSNPFRCALLRFSVASRETLPFLLCLFVFAVPARLMAATNTGLTYGCTSGSGTCFETFAGAAGVDLAAYNPNWVRITGTGSAYTTGTNSAAIPSGVYAYYAYAPSRSETSQITVDPSSSPSDYTRDACVRISPGVSGYCVGFGGAYNGSYLNCDVEKDGQFVGNGSCGPVSATTSHTLAIVASGTSTVKLSIYLDGVYTGSVADSDEPYTIPGSGFALQGGASDASSWHDYLGVTPLATMTATAYGCPSGSGSCVDTFAGKTGTALSTYNSNWIKAQASSTPYLASNTVEVAAKSSASYYYATSQSDTAQIAVPASSTAQSHAREACVRMQSGSQGYCVSFGQVFGGLYSGCTVVKNGVLVGNGSCGFPSSRVAHTLAISASGTAPVTLEIYLDGIAVGSVKDNSKTLPPAHPGFALNGDGTLADTDTGTWKDSHDSLVIPAASAPVFSPASGTYTGTQSVAITTSTPLAVIYYTTDGSTPTVASTLYKTPVKVSANTTIKALAYALGDTPSVVSSGVYVIGAPVVQTPVFSVPSPYSGSPTSVSIADATAGAKILYCVDTTNTCAPSTLYTAAISFTTSEYIRAQGTLAGDTSSAIAVWQGSSATTQITTSACPVGTQYKPYAGCTISATGGVPPYTFGWSTTSGNGLVEGLQLSPSTGVISGIAYGQGTYSIPFTVTDAAGTTVTKSITLPVNGDNTTGGCSLFPPDSIWHLNVANLPVDTSVAAPIASVYAPSALHMVFGANLNDGGIPFLRVPYNQQNVPVATTLYQSYFTSGPFPSYAPVEGTQNSGPDADRHTLVLQTAGGGNNCKLWEMWQGAPTTNGWTDSSNAYWDLGTYNMLPQDNGSTDAAGLPILPLLWNYDEVAGGCAAGAECGVVKHPGRLTLNHTLNYHVWPATAQSGLSVCTGGYEDDNHLISQSNPPTYCGGSSPMGEIYRLKSSTVTPAACTGHPQAQVLITAMRNYGLIVADNGITGGIVATADARWNDDDLACLTNLHLTDFEPVDVSGKMIDLNSSQVRP